jgi:hypothetical protein
MDRNDWSMLWCQFFPPPFHRKKGRAVASVFHV